MGHTHGYQSGRLSQTDVGSGAEGWELERAVVCTLRVGEEYPDRPAMTVRFGGEQI